MYKNVFKNCIIVFFIVIIGVLFLSLWVIVQNRVNYESIRSNVTRLGTIHVLNVPLKKSFLNYSDVTNHMNMTLSTVTTISTTTTTTTANTITTISTNVNNNFSIFTIKPPFNIRKYLINTFSNSSLSSSFSQKIDPLSICPYQYYLQQTNQNIAQAYEYAKESLFLMDYLLYQSMISAHNQPIINDKSIPRCITPVNVQLLSNKRQVPKILFLKTYKTGSGTIWSTLLRYAGVHNLRAFDVGSWIASRNGINKKIDTISSENHFDLNHYHLTLTSEKGSYTFPEYLEINAKILQSNFKKDDFIFITCVREPTSLFFSWYYFFFYPKNHNAISLDQFLDAYVTDNYQINSKGQLRMEIERRVKDVVSVWSLSNQLLLPEHNLKNWFDNTKIAQEYIDEFLDNDNMRFVYIVLERFDESLIVLKHVLNCEYIDLIYLKMHSSSEELHGFYRFDGLFVPETPKINTFSPDILKKVEALQGKSSFMLYQAAIRRLERQLSYLEKYRNINITQELSHFRCLEKEFVRLCNHVHRKYMCIEICEQMAVFDADQYSTFLQSRPYPIISPFQSWYPISEENSTDPCRKWELATMRKKRAETMAQHKSHLKNV